MSLEASVSIDFQRKEQSDKSFNPEIVQHTSLFPEFLPISVMEEQVSQNSIDVGRS